MKTKIAFIFAKILILVACGIGMVLTQCTTKAVGVTIITHGADGDVTGWVSSMADELPIYFQSRYPGLGTNFTIYTVTLTTDGIDYYYQWQRDSGSSPTNTNTGEIIVKLDWSQMAALGTTYDTSTYTVAQIASYVLLQTNTISDLNGHALAEYPIHLIGHSRGGSLMSQISYLLGTNGVWVDQLTTLDPHPLNNDGNDDFPFTTVDAPVHTYANVLFHDNYYQTEGILIDPDGEQVAGAYVRNLNSAIITGGYLDTDSTSAYHSNVHLWYYGTIDLVTPNTNDDDGTDVTIDATMRENWWVPYENYGENAGFVYSLIGGGDRMSTATPLGLPSDPTIVSGYNQYWNLGAGTSGNRTALPSNSGTWPNIIKFDITGTNIVAQGNSVITTLYYQYGGTSNLTMQVYLDGDLNPYNSNSIPLLTLQPPASGTGSVYYYATLALSTTNVPAGTYAIYAQISDGKHTRYLYTPELVQITSLLQPPILGISKSGNNQVSIAINGVSGQKIILQSSADLKTWTPIATNTPTTTSWNYINTLPASQQFYRATLSQ
jgi:hypothetical protein